MTGREAEETNPPKNFYIDARHCTKQAVAP
jgi:hypothetical protein